MRSKDQAISSSDDRLVVAAAQADSSAFAAIYERHVTDVYRYVMRRTGNPDLSEDLTAETFERAFGAIGRYEWRGAPLVSWLLRIADRACTDWYRNPARKREGSSEAGLANLPGLPSAEEQAIQAESDSRLYSALETLTPARRGVVMLHLGEGLSLAAISRRLGRGESAVRMLYARGLRDLRARLDDE
jgi:RNA polymerase sigma-70 factor (ECF subfamily)